MYLKFITLDWDLTTENIMYFTECCKKRKGALFIESPLVLRTCDCFHVICLTFVYCWKDYIEKCTAKYIHWPAVPWYPLSSLIIWWCWNMEMSEACSLFICTKPGLIWTLFHLHSESGPLPNGATSISAKVSHNEKCYECFLGWKWETKALIGLAYYCMC